MLINNDRLGVKMLFRDQRLISTELPKTKETKRLRFGVKARFKPKSKNRWGLNLRSKNSPLMDCG